MKALKFLLKVPQRDNFLLFGFGLFCSVLLLFGLGWIVLFYCFLKHIFEAVLRLMAYLP